MSVSQFIVSFIVGFFTSWKLSLVLASMLPLLGLGGWFMSKAMEQGSVSSRTYEKAGGMAEECLHQIKTVTSFANLEYEEKKYGQYLADSLKAGLRSGFRTGFGIGFIVFIVYCSYALAVGYGTKLVSEGSINENSGKKFGAGDVITVLFSVIFGCFSLGQGAPNIKAIYEAKYAAIEYFDLKERPRDMTLLSGNLMPDKSELKGRITFENVFFSYVLPDNSEKSILQGFTMNFEPGQKTAIVGASGSGKSTILNLIERFYHQKQGEIKIDNYNINEINIDYWRSLIGYVPQEPVLFNTSIRNNILFGREDISDDEILEACEKAYARELIERLGLDYIVGIKGSRLSGGERQRIAIARAILKKPKLLILDEATSALDNKSEKIVQVALDKVSQGITTIVIAHKIGTIKNSDMIIFLENGVVREKGTHHELLSFKGPYCLLVQSAMEKKKKTTDGSNNLFSPKSSENKPNYDKYDHEGSSEDEDEDLYPHNLKYNVANSHQDQDKNFESPNIKHISQIQNIPKIPTPQNSFKNSSSDPNYKAVSNLTESKKSEKKLDDFEKYIKKEPSLINAKSDIVIELNKDIENNLNFSGENLNNPNPQSQNTPNNLEIVDKSQAIMNPNPSCIELDNLIVKRPSFKNTTEGKNINNLF
jgi:ATP-binding cassette subfamily B (MDR/TAP) protein 1